MADTATLTDVLERARSLGFLGDGPVLAHVHHAEAFSTAIDTAGRFDGRALDLGSGGGVPGLILAVRFPSSRWTLLDSMERRTTFLATAIADLGLDDRVDVVTARAEVLGHDPMFRGRFDVVTARSFGSPAAVAECGAAFLRPGGRLIVSEPPGATGVRWPATGLAPLGLAPRGLVRAGTGTVEVLEAVEACPARFPRRVGVPTRRPLFAARST